MDNYGRCKDCEHVNEDERNGYKWYCNWYHTYEDPDELRDCEHYEED